MAFLFPQKYFPSTNPSDEDVFTEYDLDDYPGKSSFQPPQPFKIEESRDPKEGTTFAHQQKQFHLRQAYKDDAKLKQENAELQKKNEELHAVTKSQGKSLDIIQRTNQYSAALETMSDGFCYGHEETIRQQNEELQFKDDTISKLQTDLKNAQKEIAILKQELEESTRTNRFAVSGFQHIPGGPTQEKKTTTSTLFHTGSSFLEIEETMQRFVHERDEAVERMDRAIKEKEQLQHIHGSCDAAAQKKDNEIARLRGTISDSERAIENLRRDHNLEIGEIEEEHKREINELLEREREKLEQKTLMFEEQIQAVQQGIEEDDRIAAQKKYEEGHGQFVAARMKQQHALLIACLEHIQAVLSPYSAATAIKRVEVLASAQAQQEDNDNFLRLESEILKGLRDLTTIHRKLELCCSSAEANFKSYVAPLFDQLTEQNHKLSAFERKMESIEENETYILIAKYKSGELHRSLENLKEELRQRDKEIDKLVSQGGAGREEATKFQLQILKLEDSVAATTASLEKEQERLKQLSQSAFNLLCALSAGDQQESKKQAEQLWIVVGDNQGSGVFTFPSGGRIPLGGQRENEALMKENAKLKKKVERRDRFFKEALSNFSKLSQGEDDLQTRRIEALRATRTPAKPDF